MESGGVAEAVLFAEFGHLVSGLVQFGGIDALRHEQDFVRGDFDLSGIEQGDDFFDIRLAGDDKLELIIAVIDPRANDIGLPARFFMARRPRPCLGFCGGGMRELRAERCEIAGDAQRRNGARGFEGDMFAKGSDFGGERGHVTRHHRFPAREHDMGCGIVMDFFQNLLNRHFLTAGVPRGIRSIAPNAAKIAARCANKNARHARQ